MTLGIYVPKAGSTYRPLPGSLAFKVCMYFATDPDEELSNNDIAIKFDVVSCDVTSLLDAALKHNVLAKAKHKGMVVWRAGANIGHAEKTADGAGLPPQLVAHRTDPAGRGRRGARPRLPALDASALVVRTHVPVPPMHRGPPPASQYDNVLNRLDRVGASFEVPIVYQAAIAKAVRRYVQEHAGVTLSVRKVDDKTCGVWRMAPKQKGA